MQWLKRTRVAFAVVLVTAVSMLFLDFGNNVPAGIHTVLYSTQLIPSLVHTLTLFSSVSIGLILVLIITLLFGRVYCSTLCPLGILQDILIRLVKWKSRHRRFRFIKPIYSVHYGLLLVTAIAALTGSLILLNILEPFSYFGRILSNLVNPSVILANNAAGYILSVFGLFSIFPIQLLHVNIVSLLVSGSSLGLIVYLSYTRGRWFCNLLCPAGAFLGLLSRVSLFRIVIDENNCKDCGLCERVCKANCIQSSSKEIDFPACIGCFNCLDVCPTAGMSYSRRRKKSSGPLLQIDTKRRKVLASFFLPMVGLLLPGQGRDSSASAEINGFFVSRKHPVSPPGSANVERFSSLCTACHLCVSSCPTQVLYPSAFDYGLAGILQPKMNYDASYCNFDCVICGNVCPTGAILPLSMEIKKETQIGKATFIKDDCIVVSKKKDCGACAEHCPTKAVKMVPYEKLMLPEVNNELCVGCGACDHACPVQPQKAIYVTSNAVHQKAKKPQPQKIGPSFDSKQDFPF